MQFERLNIAHHANQSTKTYHSRQLVGGTKPQQNIHRSAVAMVNKAEHRYQVKASVSGRSIVSTQLWSKSITDKSLTRIAEVFCRAQVTRETITLSRASASFIIMWWPKKLN
jgi:phosphatidate phosphatase APP1